MSKVAPMQPAYPSGATGASAPPIPASELYRFTVNQ